jgi:4-hydroxyacetophenone monooxygenase
MVTFYALQCMERLIIEGAKAVEAKDGAMWRYNRRLDEENARKVWSDPRANNYYWSKYGRSVVQNPLSGPEMWRYLHRPDFADLVVG